MKILILDEHQPRAEGLSSALSFIREPNELVSVDNFAQFCADANQVKAFILGACSVSDYESLIRQYPEIPFLLIGETLRPLMAIANVLGILTEPFSFDVTTQHIHDCQEYHRLMPARREQFKSSTQFQGLVGETDALKHVRFLIEQVAQTEANVLILGESGTGKEVVASNIHLLSERKNGPFVPVNCGAIPGELLESELFGHEKGAFTGAISTRKGRFELAQGGTLFLDEIGDMPLQMQVKLLRVLQERSYERVGGSKPIKADVRVIAATHRNLESMISEGTFREDLFYRLNVFPIENPSLKDRADDIPLLMTELIKRISRDSGRSVKFTDRAIESIKAYDWPGNVRELANLVERMIIMFPDKVVDITDLPKKYQTIDAEAFVPEYPDEILERQALNDLFLDGFSDDDEPDSNAVVDASQMGLLPPEGIQLKEYLADLEVSLINQALEYHEYVVARAAEMLGVRRTTLVEKMRKYNLAKD